jgi:hypothetical protein
MSENIDRTPARNLRQCMVDRGIHFSALAMAVCKSLMSLPLGEMQSVGSVCELT